MQGSKSVASDEEQFRRQLELADGGGAQAQARVGWCYANGVGVDRNDKEAVCWYRKAALNGHVDAQFRLGLTLDSGRNGVVDQKEAAKWMQEAANQGFAGAEKILACFYALGRGVPRDPKLAIEWCRKAAEKDDVEAQYLLTTWYNSNDLVPKDTKEAHKWCVLASENGHKIAQYILGYCYKYGIGTSKDVEQSARWFTASAEQGQSDAQYELGLCYLYGYGVEQNENIAKRWFEKAANQEHKKAQVKLDAYNLHWRNLNEEEAACAFSRIKNAAEAGDLEAQFSLGNCYEAGTGVKEDWIKAIYWYDKAAEQGHPSAKPRLEIRKQALAKIAPVTLSHEEIVRLEKQVRELYGNHQLSEAEVKLRTLVGLSNEVLGACDSRTLASRFQLAVVLADQGKNSEAIPLFQSLLADSSKLLGVSHPDTTACRDRLKLAKRHRRNQSPTLFDRMVDKYGEGVAMAVGFLGGVLALLLLVLLLVQILSGSGARYEDPWNEELMLSPR